MSGSEGAIFSLGTDKASLVGHSTSTLGERAWWARLHRVDGRGAVAAAGTEITSERLGALVLPKVATLRASVYVASCRVNAITVGSDRADTRAVAAWGALGTNGQTGDIGECSARAANWIGEG